MKRYLDPIRLLIHLSLLPVIGMAASANAATLQVGWGKKFLFPSIAAKFAQDGDTIEIDAGDYPQDAAIWRQNRLTIRAVGGKAHLKADGAHAEGKAIWVIKGNDITIENIEFSGASVPDGNGAGIREEGAGLTIRNCHFHDNQNGILTGSNDASDILIENSEFASNGADDGRTHNMYIGAVRNFTLKSSYSHHARVGHNVKSRARTNYILYNRIMDEQDGNSSYAIDLSNGGIAYVIGNLIQQGPKAENSGMVSYGAEGLHMTLPNALYFVNNTVVNDRPQGGVFVFAKPGASPVRILNNLFIGKGRIDAAGGVESHNIMGSKGDLLAPATYDFRLKPGSKAADAGMDPGKAGDISLWPTDQYLHKASSERRPRSGKLDAGAYESR